MIIKAILLMAVSILIVAFSSKISQDLIYVGEYQHLNNKDMEISSVVLDAMALSNEGNITIYKNINFNGKVVFEDNKFEIILGGKSRTHTFNEAVFSKNALSEISKISCIKINGSYIMAIQ